MMIIIIVIVITLYPPQLVVNTQQILHILSYPCYNNIVIHSVGAWAA